MTLARQRRSVALKIAGTVALGAAVTLGVYSFFSKQSQTVDIVVAAKPLVPGEVPTKSDLAVEAVPQQSVTPGMIPVANVRVLNNQVVTTTIPQNAPVLVSELAPHLRGNYRVFVLTPSVIPPNLTAGDTVDIYAPLQAQASGSSSGSSNAPMSYTAPAPYIPVATAIPVLAVIPSSNGGSSQLEIEVPPNEASDIAAVADSSNLVIAFAPPNAKPVPIVQLQPSVHTHTVN